MSETSARYGWQSDLPAFVQASPAAIESALEAKLKFAQGNWPLRGVPGLLAWRLWVWRG